MRRHFGSDLSPRVTEYAYASFRQGEGLIFFHRIIQLPMAVALLLSDNLVVVTLLYSLNGGKTHYFSGGNTVPRGTRDPKACGDCVRHQPFGEDATVREAGIL